MSRWYELIDSLLADLDRQRDTNRGPTKIKKMILEAEQKAARGPLIDDVNETEGDRKVKFRDELCEAVQKRLIEKPENWVWYEAALAHIQHQKRRLRRKK